MRRWIILIQDILYLQLDNFVAWQQATWESCCQAQYFAIVIVIDSTVNHKLNNGTNQLPLCLIVFAVSLKLRHQIH